MGVACTGQHLAILLYSKCGHLLRVTWRVGRVERERVRRGCIEVEK